MKCTICGGDIMSKSKLDPSIKKYLSLVHEHFKCIPETNNGRVNSISLTV